MKYFSIKEYNEYEYPADVLREFPCPVCEFLSLEITMLDETCEKK